MYTNLHCQRINNLENRNVLWFSLQEISIQGAIYFKEKQPWHIILNHLTQWRQWAGHYIVHWFRLKLQQKITETIKKEQWRHVFNQCLKHMMDVHEYRRALRTCHDIIASSE